MVLELELRPSLPDLEVVGRETLGLVWPFETPDPIPSDILPLIWPHLPIFSQTILLTGDQTLKYTSLWGHSYLSHHSSITFYYLVCLTYSLYTSGHLTVSLGWEHHLWTRYKHCDAATPKDTSSITGR